MTINRIIIPYKPRSQFIDYHNRNQRWSIIVAHRRAGKTVSCVNDLIKQACICESREPRFAYVAPTYAQAKDVAWSYLKYYAGHIPYTTINESELHVTFAHNGARIRLYGSDNYDRMRGIYLDGVVSDEYGDQDPRAWTEVIRPALSDRCGYATFIGTPRGQNHFKDMWDKAQSNPDWLCLILRASETGLIKAEELYDAKKHMTAEQFAAEYECSFSGSLMGAYFAREIEELERDGRTKGDWWRPDYLVHTAWDVGGTTAIWCFQLVDGRVYVIDYIEGYNQTAAWYVERLRAKKYKYGKHILPSDAGDPKEIVAYSWQDSLLKLDFGPIHLLPKQRSIIEGIQAAKMLIPRCYFSDATKEGRTALINYHEKWDDKRKTFTGHEDHDWSSHSAAAFRYLAVGLEAVSKEKAKVKNISLDVGGLSYMGV